MTNKEKVKKLREVRRLIMKGWGKKRYHNHGRYCLAGAINKAVAGLSYGTGAVGTAELREPVCVEIAKELNCSVDAVSIILFNDHEETRKADVLRVVDSTIRTLSR